MRKLDRKRIPIPASLKGENSNGGIETAAAIKFYTSRTTDKKKGYPYAAYNTEVIKKALSDLSYDKCAYCEIRARASHDSDIEHFRPKGEVIEENKISIKPGYYWLAAEWTNLFLSCQHCNQERKQLQMDDTKRSMGKKNKFPLKDRTKRVKSHNDKISAEERYRLLIDPCKDDPMKHIEFDDAGMIYARTLKNGKLDPKGQASIEVFALIRKYLVDTRKEVALQLLGALSSYKDAAEEYDKFYKRYKPAEKKDKEKKLAEQINRLKLYTDTDKQFSAMSINIIQRFLDRMGLTYKI